MHPAVKKYLKQQAIERAKKRKEDPDYIEKQKKASRAYWDNVSPEERSKLMSERRRKGIEKQKSKLGWRNAKSSRKA